MRLTHDILNVPVSELDRRELIAVRPTTTIRECLRRMRDKGLGCAFIVDHEGKPTRKFSEKQLMPLLAQGEAIMTQSVEPHGDDRFHTVTLQDPISKVIGSLTSGDQRYVCVVDDKGRAIALTGQRGVMEYLADHFPRSVKVLLMESKLYMDQREGA